MPCDSILVHDSIDLSRNLINQFLDSIGVETIPLTLFEPINIVFNTNGVSLLVSIEVKVLELVWKAPSLSEKKILPKQARLWECLCGHAYGVYSGCITIANNQCYDVSWKGQIGIRIETLCWVAFFLQGYIVTIDIRKDIVVVRIFSQNKALLRR